VTARGRPVIAVFTKNRTNPAYTAARLGADRTGAWLGTRIVHYVPRRPDSIEDQARLVEQAIGERADAVVFVPVHATAMNESVRRHAIAASRMIWYSLSVSVCAGAFRLRSSCR